MKEYLELLKHVKTHGEIRQNRTGIATLSVFGTQTRYPVGDAFPLLTTKKVFFKGIVHELLWFISGNTNIKYLVDHQVNIWNEWAYERFQKSTAYQNETMSEYLEKIRTDVNFAQIHGDLGPIYGHQWRNFNGVDQLSWVLQEIKTNPDSRRLIVSAWNPKDIPEMALPPCHTFFQFYVSNQGQTLNLQLYQRSADLFLGVPFNIASYALLLRLVAQECHLQAGELVHTIGDTHIYTNHLAQIELQLSREPFPLPQLQIKPFQSLFDVQFTDIELIDYQSHPQIKGVVAV